MMQSDRSRIDALVAPETLRFILAALLGTASIVALHVWNINQFTITAMPIFVILVYGSWEYFFDQTASPDELGDRLYYLGFLFTLVSVAYSLWKFAGIDRDVQQILSNFGIALGTTITGLILRVILNQVHEDPVELERRSRMDLRDAAMDLRLELNSAVEDVRNFRRDVLLSTGEGVQQLIRSASDALKDSIAAVTGATETAAARIDSALLQLPNRGSQVDEAADKLIQGLVKYGRAVELLKVDPDPLAAELKPLRQALARNTKVIDKFADASEDSAKKLTDEISRLNGAIGEMEERIKNVSLSTISDSAQKAADDLGRLSSSTTTSADRVTKQVAKMVAALQSLKVEAAESLNSATRHREALEKELSVSRDLVIQVQRALLSSAELILQRLNNGATRDQGSSVS
jgi:methyl-accepting chemotaxis protein